MTFDDFSFMMINTMLSISVPGIAKTLQKVLVNFIYFDILMTEKWLPSFLNWINGEDTNNEVDSPLNNFFEENGFSSKLFMKNIGSTLVFLILYIFLWLIIGLLSILSNYSQR